MIAPDRKQAETLWCDGFPLELVANDPRFWLVFANAGSDGILFGYDLGDSTDRIWAWHPIEARRQLIASSCANFENGYEGTPFKDFVGRLDGWKWPHRARERS